MTGRIFKQFEAVLNRALKLDPETQSGLAKLSGRVLALEILNTGLVLHLIPAAEGIRLESDYGGETNVTIRGTPVNLMTYLMSTSGKTEGFTGRLEIVGDVGLAQEFQTLMKNVDLDWEEFLSHWLGDTLAHKMGNLFRGSVSLARNTKHTLELDVSEYLRYEKEFLPEKQEVEEYITAIDELRNDAERLHLRINKLAKAAEDIK